MQALRGYETNYPIYIATNAPLNICEYRECNGLIVKGKIEIMGAWVKGKLSTACVIFNITVIYGRP
jgi:hypothetical protein